MVGCATDCLPAECIGVRTRVTWAAASVVLSRSIQQHVLAASLTRREPVGTPFGTATNPVARSLGAATTLAQLYATEVSAHLANGTHLLFHAVRVAHRPSPKNEPAAWILFPRAAVSVA